MTRKSNIELIRIFSMILIVLVHTNFSILGAVTCGEMAQNAFRAFGRILFEQLCIVGVNVFVLISGYFGIRPTKKKFFNIMFQILFWSGLSTMVGLLSEVDVPTKTIAKTFWLGGGYWFVPEYVALFAFSPVLNKFIERNDVHDYLDKNFDFDNKDSFIELFEYGIVLYLPFYSKINNQSIKSIKQFIKDDKNWELFKNDDNFAWYIPGVRNLLMVDIEDMYKYENDLIILYKDTHDIK